MLLMACRARPILNDVRFMRAVLLVAALAFAIDRFDGDAVSKTIAQHFAKFPSGDVAVVALSAVVSELGVTGRNVSGVKKCLAAATRKKKNREQTAEDRQQADDQPCPPPGMKATVITEIAFVTLGDLLLRARRFRHRLSS